MNYKSRLPALPYANVPYLVGIDEAGRGPIAGPVTVAALVLLPNKGRPTSFIGERLKGVKDSKQLTEKRRGYWRNMIERLVEEGTLKYAVHSTEASVIDAKGIVFAVQHSLAAALAELALPPEQCFVQLDGALKAPSVYRFQETIIRGDETELLITLAGLVAKTTRDADMVRRAAEHPEYGFDAHKGYGTKAHFEAIQQCGLCDMHRKTFIQARDSSP